MVASSAPAAERSMAMRCAVLRRTLYQTEFLVAVRQPDSTSPGSVVAPTVVPFREAGSVWICSAADSASLAGGGGPFGAGVVASSPDAAAASTATPASANASVSTDASIRSTTARDRL